MQTPLQVISNYGCPTNSYIAAIHFFSEKEDLSLEQYQQGIKDIVSLSEVETMSYPMTRAVFLYLIQETIKAYKDSIPDMDELYDICLHKAELFLETHPWHLLRYAQTTETSNTEVDMKGGKKTVTERIFKDMKAQGASRREIIEAFEEATGMSKAGATTYFHTLKKEYGFVEKKKTAKAKKESKQDIANRLYQEAEDKSKSVLIELFTEKLGTSKLGAQTYYYACKKKFEP